MHMSCMCHLCASLHPLPIADLLETSRLQVHVLVWNLTKQQMRLLFCVKILVISQAHSNEAFNLLNHTHLSFPVQYSV